MELNEEQLKKLKELELECLRTLISLCEQNDLRWCLAGGSLLGAVRHQGFIPWDDDIDLVMPRRDYDVLCRLKMPEPYFLQCLKTEPACGILFAKLMNTDTVYIESSRRHMDIHHGVCVDIFPVDYYPEQGLPDLWQWGLHMLMHYRMRSLYADAHRIRPLYRKIGAELCMAVSKLILPDAQKAMIWYEQKLRHAERSSKVIVTGGAYDRKDIYRISWLGFCRKALFEGIPVNIPVHYDEILRQTYGCYMELPPAEERKGHHFAEVFHA